MDSEKMSGRENKTENENKSADILYTLVLLTLPGIGPSRYWQLIDLFGSAKQVLYADIASLPKAVPSSTMGIIQQLQNNFESHRYTSQVKNEIEWCYENNVRTLSVDDRDYPSLLSKIHSPPPVLYVKGDINNLSLPQLAVVGSRNPTPAGKENAFHFSKELVKTGFSITSGLALGIDASAHLGALSGGNHAKGKTIAVLGTGIDKIYPQRHRQLVSDIVENGGAIVSEFAVGVGPHASNFPRRNRVISGLSLGVLVVEAAVKSGSLITARLAMEQDREVFALPGSIHNPLSRGSHSLIKNGAQLVEQVSDLQESLQGLLEYKKHELHSENTIEMTGNINDDNLCDEDNQIEKKCEESISKEEQEILDAIGFDETSFDVLAARLEYETGELLSALMTMELRGLILPTATGYMRATINTTISTTMNRAIN
ncbi:MAG: DNA-processing protein DprA [Cellvibrionaceae bacterium]